MFTMDKPIANKKLLWMNRLDSNTAAKSLHDVFLQSLSYSN